MSGNGLANYNRASLVMTSTGLMGTVVGGCVDLLAGKTLSYMTSGATGT
jgi:hypothetical protein